MSDDIRSLIQEHRAFYEVLPYYVRLEEEHVSLPAAPRRVQAGFNVDVYGVRTEDTEPAAAPPANYLLGWAELQKMAERVSQHTRDSCFLEVIPFPSVAIIDGRDGSVEAMIRIRISHWRGLDQPAGLAEQRALEEVRKELDSLGIKPR
jgi:hypothetical protein